MTREETIRQLKKLQKGIAFKWKRNRDWCEDKDIEAIGEAIKMITPTGIRNLHAEREDFMYESPIEKVVGEIQTQMIQDEENRLMCEVRQTIGYNIDKEELLKALKYDRDQYEKGFNDGNSWISVKERLPEENETVIGLDCSDSICKAERYDDCGEIKWYANGCFDVPIVAWMKLPEYTESED